MSFLSDLYNKARSGWESLGIHTGSWGTPEFKITEAAAKGLGTVQAPGGGSNIYGDPGQTTGSLNTGLRQEPIYTYMGNKTPMGNDNTYVINKKTDTGGGGGDSGGGGGDSGGGPTLEELQRQAWEREMNAIRARLDETRYQAGLQRTRGKENLDEFLGYTANRFPELENRAEARRTSSLDDLTNEESKLQTLYDKANARARRRSESSALKNRMIARAGNRLGSSFYDELVAENQENLGRILADSDMERLDKVGAVGKRKTETDRYFDETISDINDTRTQLESQAYNEYQRVVDEADALDRAGLLDFGQSEGEARSNLESKLANIKMWADNVLAQRTGVDTAYNNALNTVNMWDTYGNALPGVLANNQNLNTANNYQSNMMGSGNQTNQNNLALLLAMSRQNKDKELLNSMGY